MHTFNHILVATDFSDAANEAVAIATDLARRFDAELTLLHVAVPPAFESAPEARWRAEDALAMVEEQLEALVSQVRARHGRTRCLLRTGVVHEQILAAADEQAANLLVTGTRERGALSHLWSASVAAKLVRLARIPVITVHAPGACAADADAA